MQLIQTLNCTGNIYSCCSDYGLANILSILQKILNIIHILIPIILMAMVTVSFIKMVINPDEKKNMKSLINKVLAAVLVFFLPTFVHAVMFMMPTSFEIYSCWDAASEVSEIISATKVSYANLHEDDEYSKVLSDPDDYEKGNERETASKGDGTILIIAGHSYPPYCASSPTDCRGTATSSGYDETVETRKLAKLVKSELSKLNVKADIANALMAGDEDKMNKSFYKECSTGSSICKKYDWGKYSYALEIHFNASSSHTATGALLVKTTAGYSTKADKDILNAIVKHTNKKIRSDSVQSIHNIRYLQNKNVPITYVEVEFYDNKSAMNTYTSKK